MPKLRDLLAELKADLKQAIANTQVTTQVEVGCLGRQQRILSERIEDVGAQLVRIEHDLAIIKEYLVTKMREGEQE